MQTKHYISKKITYTIFGNKYYHSVKSKKILFDFLIGKDYDGINKQLSKILSTDDIIIDIGANMGQYLSRLSKIVKKGKIICVEPIPSNVIALNFMKSILRIKNVIIISKAIAEKPGSAIITIPKMSGIPISTQASFIENCTLKDSEKEKIEVETTTIDKIVDSLHLHKINFIKVDTEGFDSTVIKSGANSIRKFMPLLKVEGSCFKPEMNWLFDLGYKALKFKGNRVVFINNNDENIKYKGDTFLATEEQLTRIMKIFL